jgi:predicted transglutaminase-like cysteine proteinase
MLRPDDSTVFDDINGGTTTKTDPVTLVFTTINNLNLNAYKPRDKIVHDPLFINIWLQFPNDIIKDLASQIVDPGDSDDVKMAKIQKWVVFNIDYMTDKEQYGYAELWVPPVMVLSTMKGDCEDGAFLIMSLALNAGVDPSRLRLYGGFVEAGEGAAYGGHAWVSYRRESDDEWVAVDFSYYADLRPMDVRTPLKNDKRYVDDFFYITNQFIVYTEDTNRIREPEVYYSDGRMTPNIFFPSGSTLSLFA